MPHLCSSLLLSLLIASAGSAVTIEYSNPRYYVSNVMTTHKPGDAFAYLEVYESNANDTGDLVISSDTGYATAYGASDAFHLRASSSVDSSQIAAHGWDSVRSEGLAQFETDFVITSDQAQVPIYLGYAFTQDFVGDADQGLHQLVFFEWVPDPRRPGRHWWDVVQPDTSGPEQYIFSLTPGALYQLRMAINALTGPSAALSTAATGLDASLSLYPIPEPSTGLLVIAGLVGLAVRRRPRA